eukprot:3052633-Heterocapsa_arctica.AAC.1
MGGKGVFKDTPQENSFQENSFKDNPQGNSLEGPNLQKLAKITSPHSGERQPPSLTDVDLDLVGPASSRLDE